VFFSKHICQLHILSAIQNKVS